MTIYLADKNSLDTEGSYLSAGQGHIFSAAKDMAGREDGVYSLKNPQNGVFVFVIEGAFEVQNRLLEPRDGLAISAVEAIEFEALSNNAIILFLEIKIIF